MLLRELEERRLRARRALDGATSDNLVGLCKRYLARLAEYRAELYKLRGTPGVSRPSDALLTEGTGGARLAVRAAIENITRERNETEALLLSFTAVSGCEAVETFNGRKYQGHDDWELRTGRVSRSEGGPTDESLTVLEAVDIASSLRREEHVARSAARRSR